jgi:prophage regulatory protein
MSERIVKLPEVLDRTGLSRTAVYACMAAGTFPAPVKLNARAVGWKSTDLDAWITGVRDEALRRR